MNGFRGSSTRLLAIAVGLFALSAGATAATLDRHYRMGDDPSEGASAGGAVNITFDSVGQAGQGQLVDLTAVNTPTYAAITGRPDGGSGLGIQFNAAQQEYLHGFNLGFPEDSFSAATHHTPTGGALDYLGISNRGLQFWVRPTSTAVQTLVMDTNQHGVRINANGRFSMRYGGADYESTQAVTPNTWYHVEVVRPNFAANGSRMFINGVAVAAAPGGYADDWADLTVGTNTAGDDQPSPGFTGGTAEFFSGIVDELKLFVIGSSTSATPVNYGGFNLAADNDFVASPVTGIKGIAGDVTNDGALNQADKDAFIAGWLDRRIVGGFQIGDMASRAQGDLNLDGITDIHDLLIFQNALSGAGIGTITAADLQGAVPEPASLVLIFVTLLMMPRVQRARRSFRSES
jgi:Concanavalin A-like lectin/glucanases superfamily